MRIIGIASGLFALGALLLAPIGCSQPTSTPGASILLFAGTGTSPNDVKAFEKLLTQGGYLYDTASSARLNATSDDQLAAYRLLLIPGGNYLTMGRSLTPETSERVRNAVHGGVHYLGVCAGGLLAGKAESNSFNLTSGVKFDFYQVVNRGIHKAAVPISFKDLSVIEHYWEDGPHFTGWGDVVGNYPDGTPAIVEGAFGKGRVILCGVHPEAPESWRKGLKFTSSAATANQYTMTLIDATLNGQRLLQEPAQRPE